MAKEVSILGLGTPIAKLDRYPPEEEPGTDQTYQEVVSWTVPSGKSGVLYEVSFVTNKIDKTQFRLTFRKSLSGTLAFTNGSTAVTGSGTFFRTELEVGDKIILDADEVWAEVDSIGSDTALTLTAAYTGTGGSGAGSKVWGFEDKYIQAALSLKWEDNKLAAGTEVKLETKSTDGTAIVVDGSITGKTMEYE